MQVVFGTDGSVFDHLRMNWLEYDRAARALVWRMVRDKPRAVITTFLYYKPLMLVRTLGWATGWSAVPVQTIAMEPEWLSTPGERTANDEYLRWFRPAPACLFLLGAALVAWRGRSSVEPVRHGSPWLVVSVMFVASLIPAFFVWPAFQWVADTMVTTGLVAYAGLTWGLVSIMNRVDRTEATRHDD
jgi:hypothetical protein